MLRLNTIQAHRGATHKTKRLGRGSASGRGGTAGKGHKGQNARSGGGVRPGFEGGQNPLYRRIPKRGFKNINRRSNAIVNLADLERFDPAQLKEVSLESLKEIGRIKGHYERFTVLGNGEITKAFAIRAHKVSEKAREKIEKAGGKVELIPIVRHSRKLAEERSSKA